MLRRCSPVMFVGLSCAFLVGAPTPVHAHRLEADYRVLPGQRLQVEAWFDLTAEPAREAHIQVFRGDAQVLFDSHLDARGTAVFLYGEAEPLRVVVSAGEGHVKEVQIPAAKLEAGLNGREKPRPASWVATSETRTSPAPALARVSKPVPPPEFAPEIRFGSLQEEPAEARSPTNSGLEPFADRSTRVSAWNVALGIALLMGIAGIAVLMRRTRQRRAVRR